jgi:uncharacterized membrane protein
MKKVNIIWRVLFILMIGYALGTFVTIKYMVPPSTAIHIGKMKLKGDGSTLSPNVTVTPEGDTLSRRERRKAERKEKKDIRAQDRAIKKAARKRNNDGG